MEKNKLETKVKGKNPFYKTWWFILIVVIVIAGMFGSNEEEVKATETKTEVVEEQEEIKYEILEDRNYENKNGVNKRNLEVLIHKCDISKKEMYKELLPKLTSYAKGYSLQISFYCDKRFFEVKRVTNGTVGLSEDGTTWFDSIKLHTKEELLTDKEISVYTEYNFLKGKVNGTGEEVKKQYKKIEEEMLKKYNITEKELFEIDSKGFGFTL